MKVVTVECIGCKARREVGPGEIPAGEVPMCSLCLLPMVAVRATRKSKKDHA